MSRTGLRQQQARPILDRFRVWLDQQLSAADNPVLPKSPMGQAIAYADQLGGLCRYSSDGDLAIDNNAAERTLRAVVTGRKNWLFAGSDAGGRTAAILYSFTSSCHDRHKLDSFAYLRRPVYAPADPSTRAPRRPAAGPLGGSRGAARTLIPTHICTYQPGSPRGSPNGCSFRTRDLDGPSRWNTG